MGDAHFKTRAPGCTYIFFASKRSIIVRRCRRKNIFFPPVFFSELKGRRSHVYPQIFSSDHRPELFCRACCFAADTPLTRRLCTTRTYSAV